jgi:hypothetical protein
MRISLVPRIAASALLFTIVSAVGAEATQLLAPHRAVYDIELENAADSTGITALSGRMVYEFAGSPCDGYTVKFRYVTRIDTSEDSRLTDQQSTTFENGEGNVFTFATKSFINDSLDTEVRGTAHTDHGKTLVDLKKPEEKRIDIGSALFPTRHMIDLIKRAKEGQSFYEAALFDGSDDRPSGAAGTFQRWDSSRTSRSGRSRWPTSIPMTSKAGKRPRHTESISRFMKTESRATSSWITGTSR